MRVASMCVVGNGADLEDEELAHDPKVDLAEAGHALQVVHEGQQVGQQR